MTHIGLIRVGYDDARLRQWSGQAPERARRAVRAFLTKAGQLGVREMRGVARERFGRIGVRHPGILGTGRGGALAASIRATRGPDYVDISPNVPYEADVDDGTGPHVIRPKNGKALHWGTRFVTSRSIDLPGGVNLGRKRLSSRTNHVFAKEVHHPGFRGHRYTLHTARRLGPKLGPLMDSILGREVTR